MAWRRRGCRGARRGVGEVEDEAASTASALWRRTARRGGGERRQPGSVVVGEVEVARSWPERSRTEERGDLGEFGDRIVDPHTLTALKTPLVPVVMYNRY